MFFINLLGPGLLPLNQTSIIKFYLSGALMQVGGPWQVSVDSRSPGWMPAPNRVLMPGPGEHCFNAGWQEVKVSQNQEVRSSAPKPSPPLLLCAEEQGSWWYRDGAAVAQFAGIHHLIFH